MSPIRRSALSLTLGLPLLIGGAATADCAQADGEALLRLTADFADPDVDAVIAPLLTR